MANTAILPIYFNKMAVAHADLFCAFLPVLVGLSPCCPEVLLSACCQAGFLTGFAPERFTLGFLDLGMRKPFLILGRHRRFEAGLIPTNLGLDLTTGCPEMLHYA